MRRRTPGRWRGHAPRRLLVAALLAVLVAVVAGCRATARVDIDVRTDGSGVVMVTVALDPAAAQQLGDPTQVSLDDLRRAGWRVTAPTAGTGGARPDTSEGLRWVLRRSFASPQDLARVLDEVGGAQGVFRGVRLVLDDGFGTTAYRFRTRVELSGDLAQFSDPDLTTALGGVATGWTPEDLAAAGADGPDAAQLVVSVGLPGGTPTTNGTVVGGTSRWRFPLTGGRATSETLRTESSEESVLPLVLAVVGAALLLCGLVTFVVAMVRRR